MKNPRRSHIAALMIVASGFLGEIPARGADTADRETIVDALVQRKNEHAAGRPIDASLFAGQPRWQIEGGTSRMIRNDKLAALVDQTRIGSLRFFVAGDRLMVEANAIVPGRPDVALPAAPVNKDASFSVVNGSFVELFSDCRLRTRRYDLSKENLQGPDGAKIFEADILICKETVEIATTEGRTALYEGFVELASLSIRPVK